MTENSTSNYTGGVGNDKRHQSGAVRSIFRSGLGRTLLLWFLCISLIPVATVGVIGYLNAHARIKENARESLKLVCMEHARDIENYFSRMLMDLRRKSAKRVNYEFLEDLTKGFKESHEPLRKARHTPKHSRPAKRSCARATRNWKNRPRRSRRRRAD